MIRGFLGGGQQEADGGRLRGGRGAGAKAVSLDNMPCVRGPPRGRRALCSCAEPPARSSDPQGMSLLRICRDAQRAAQAESMHRLRAIGACQPRQWLRVGAPYGRACFVVYVICIDDMHSMHARMHRVHATASSSRGEYGRILISASACTHVSAEGSSIDPESNHLTCIPRAQQMLRPLQPRAPAQSIFVAAIVISGTAAHIIAASSSLPPTASSSPAAAAHAAQSPLLEGSRRRGGGHSGRGVDWVEADGIGGGGGDAGVHDWGWATDGEFMKRLARFEHKVDALADTLDSLLVLAQVLMRQGIEWW